MLCLRNLGFDRTEGVRVWKYCPKSSCGLIIGASPGDPRQEARWITQLVVTSPCPVISLPPTYSPKRLPCQPRNEACTCAQVKVNYRLLCTGVSIVPVYRLPIWDLCFRSTSSLIAQCCQGNLRRLLIFRLTAFLAKRCIPHDVVFCKLTPISAHTPWNIWPARRWRRLFYTTPIEISVNLDVR